MWDVATKDRCVLSLSGALSVHAVAPAHLPATPKQEPRFPAVALQGRQGTFVLPKGKDNIQYIYFRRGHFFSTRVFQFRLQNPSRKSIGVLQPSEPSAEGCRQGQREDSCTIL